MKTKTTLTLLLATLVIMTGCAVEDQTQQQAQGKLKVTATIGMVASIVDSVGQDNIEITSLMGPGVDPHLYKATEADVRALTDADVIFYNGLHLESKLGDILEDLSARKTVVAVAENIPTDRPLQPDDYEGLYDPHVWFDVQLWMLTVDEVANTLSTKDPTNADQYQQNAQALKTQLQELDEYVKERVEEIPEDQRVLVTAHDAFNYFGEAYGFEVKGLQGISTESEPGAKDVQEIVDFVVQRKIKAIFIESSIPERNVKAVQEAAAAQDWDLQIGGELFSDAMGEEGSIEGTYIGMVTHNIDTIADALK